MPSLETRLTIGAEQLPSPSDVDTMYSQLREHMRVCIKPWSITASTMHDSETPGRYLREIYSGDILGLIAKPPSVIIEVHDASVQTAECACDYSGTDPIEDYELAMGEATLSSELDEIAGVETKDPHWDDIPEVIGSVITVPLDRVAWFGLSGMMVD